MSMPGVDKTGVMVFSSPLGGVGQTSLVANVAEWLNAMGQPSLVWELSCQNTLGLHLGLTDMPTEGWAQRVARGQWLGDAAIANQDGIHALLHGAVNGVEEQVKLADWWRREGALANDLSALTWPANGVVLLDAPGWGQSHAQAVMAVADLAVVMVDVSWRSCALTPVLKVQQAALAERGCPMVVLPARFDPRRDSQREAMAELKRQWGDHLVGTALHEDDSAAHALHLRRTWRQAVPFAQCSHDMLGIAQALQLAMLAGLWQ